MQEYGWMQAVPVDRPVREARAAPLFLRIAFWLSIVIAVAVVIRRLLALASPAVAGPPELLSLDHTFAAHRPLTLAHIIPALVFVLLTPLVLLWKLAPAERLLFPTGAVVGITAYAMSLYSVGGWTERSAVLVFNTIFLYSLWRAFQHREHPVQKRRWLVRAIVVLFGIATTRPVMGLFFATSPITHLKPSQFFGIAFWVGFSINLIIAEVWLRKRSGNLTSAM
jgi:hypothetical protein